MSFNSKNISMAATIPVQYRQPPPVIALPQNSQQFWADGEGRVLSSAGVIIVFLGVISVCDEGMLCLACSTIITDAIRH